MDPISGKSYNLKFFVQIQKGHMLKPLEKAFYADIFVSLGIQKIGCFLHVHTFMIGPKKT